MGVIIAASSGHRKGVILRLTSVVILVVDIIQIDVIQLNL
jgi:hypothetical protein